MAEPGDRTQCRAPCLRLREPTDDWQPSTASDAGVPPPECHAYEWCRDVRKETARENRARNARTVLLLMIAAILLASRGCRPKVVSTPTVGLPSVVVQTVREEDAMLRYSITASYPELPGTLSPGVLEKVNKAIATMVLPDIAGLKQNAADAAWAAKYPSDAAELPADQGSFLGAEYEIPYLTSDIISVRIRFQTITTSAPRGFTNSKFDVLQTPVTSTPKYLASCAAEVPTALEAP
jgi:hypothetical protein